MYLEFKPRAVVAVRVRRCVIRVDVHEAVVRIVVVAGPQNNTAALRLSTISGAKVDIFFLTSKKNPTFVGFKGEIEQPLSRFSICRFRSLLNDFDFASEGKPRAVVAARVRRCVTRVDVHEAVVRIVVDAGPQNNTAGRVAILLLVAIVGVV